MLSEFQQNLDNIVLNSPLVCFIKYFIYTVMQVYPAVDPTQVKTVWLKYYSSNNKTENNWSSFIYVQYKGWV